MYRLKQAARIDFDNLVRLLEPHCYFPIRESPGLWKHQTHYMVFNLCVDNFSINANSIYYAHHLINAIIKYFKCSIDWEGKNYLGLTLDWKYAQNYVNISIPGHITTALQKFEHKPLERPQYSPNIWNKPVDGNQKILTQKINSTDTNRVQSINGTFL